MWRKSTVEKGRSTTTTIATATIPLTRTRGPLLEVPKKRHQSFFAGHPEQSNTAELGPTAAASERETTD